MVVIDFSSKQVIETSVDKHLTQLIEEWLVQTPEELKLLLETKVQDLVLPKDWDFERLVKNYIIHKIDQAKVPLSVWVVQWINYLSDFLSWVMKVEKPSHIAEVIDNPYFTHWAAEGDYKKAWDASTYNYIFWIPKWWLSKNDQLRFALTWYSNYFWDDGVTTGIGMVLPQIQWVATDKSFLSRGLQSV